MRVLFSFVGGTGHAEPLVAVAAAVREAGHEVAFAGNTACATSRRGSTVTV